jgi:hypothetical protein
MLDIATEAKLEPVDAPSNGVEARAERAAGRTGFETAEIEKLPFDLSALEDEGVFVNVDARGFGLLDRRLEWHALGVSLPRGTNIAFRPPRCGLLPDRYRLPLLRPAARAHAALHKYSYRFTLTETLFETPAYRWVPWSAFEVFERDFQATQEALEAARASVLDQYEGIREEVFETILRLADDSARRLIATGHVVPEGYRDVIARGIDTAVPTPDDLRDKLTLRYRIGVVMLGSEMLAEQRRVREERGRIEAIEATARVERQQQQARARLVQEELWADEERIRRRLQAEEDERRREADIKERLRNLKLEAAKERLQEALSPIEEGAQQLHSAVFEAASAIRTSLRKHGTLPGGSVRRAREITRWFRLMNWQSDQQLEALLAELETLASRPAGKRKRDTGPIDQVLSEIVEICYADARAIAEPNRMAALEL